MTGVPYPTVGLVPPQFNAMRQKDLDDIDQILQDDGYLPAQVADYAEWLQAGMIHVEKRFPRLSWWGGWFLPDPNYAVENQHFMPPTEEAYDASERWVRLRVEKAEAADYGFAIRMQGLMNGTLAAVWCSMDPSPNGKTDDKMIDVFMTEYMAKFYGEFSITNGFVPKEVIQEALHLHHSFCKDWVRQNKRTVSPLLEAMGETFVGLLCGPGGVLAPFVRPTLGAPPLGRPTQLSRIELTRLLRRHETLGSHFASCLHFYVGKLEADRGSRNNNYKAMNRASNHAVVALKSLHDYLTQHKTLLQTHVNEVCALPREQKLLHWRIVDWFEIADQLPLPDQFRGYKQDFTPDTSRQLFWQHKATRRRLDGVDYQDVPRGPRPPAAVPPPPPAGRGGRGGRAGGAGRGGGAAPEENAGQANRDAMDRRAAHFMRPGAPRARAYEALAAIRETDAAVRARYDAVVDRYERERHEEIIEQNG